MDCLHSPAYKLCSRRSMGCTAPGWMLCRSKLCARNGVSKYSGTAMDDGLGDHAGANTASPCRTPSVGLLGSGSSCTAAPADAVNWGPIESMSLGVCDDRGEQPRRRPSADECARAPWQRVVFAEGFGGTLWSQRWSGCRGRWRPPGRRREADWGKGWTVNEIPSTPWVSRCRWIVLHGHDRLGKLAGSEVLLLP